MNTREKQQMLLVQEVLEQIEETYEERNYKFLQIDTEKRNNLFQTSAESAMFWHDLTPVQKAALVPKISIYIIDKKDNSAKRLPFPEFLSPKDIEQITKSRSGRGEGVGLRKFEWSLKGRNPAEERSYIDVDIELIFQTFHDFVQDRGNGTSFQQLITYSKNKKAPFFGGTESARQIFPKDFQIKATVGWSVPRGVTKDIIPKNLKRAIENSLITLHLELVQHNFVFHENGQVSLTISYKSAIETFLKHGDMNILPILADLDSPIPVDEKASITIQEKKKQFLDAILRRENATQQDIVNCKDLQNIQDEIENLERKIKTAKYEIYRPFLTTMSNNQQIYEIGLVDLEDFITFLNPDVHQVDPNGFVSAESISSSRTKTVKTRKLNISQAKKRVNAFSISENDKHLLQPLQDPWGAHRQDREAEGPRVCPSAVQGQPGKGQVEAGTWRPWEILQARSLQEAHTEA